MGALVVSLGFSVQAEPAHQNQEGSLKKNIGSKSAIQSRTLQGLSVQFPSEK